MTSLHLLFLFFALIAMGRTASLPTKAEICANPTFDGGLAVADPLDDSIVKRYLFWGKFVMPYIRENSRQEIDWKNIGFINETFEGNTFPWNNGVYFAFQSKNKTSNEEKIYIRFKNDKKNYMFERKGSKFTYKEAVNTSKMGHQLFRWELTTDSNSKIYIFVDSSLVKKPSEAHRREQVSYDQGKFAFITVNIENISSSLNLNEVFPNTMIFTNTRGNRYRIPVEFDGYYQTMYWETIFFKGQTACVTILNKPIEASEAEYCRRFIDTRTIIGCETNTFDDNPFGPEYDPNEPDDIEPDF